MALAIEEVTAATQELAERLSVLVRQLSSSTPEVSQAHLAAIVAAPAATLFTAVEDGRVLGMLTLVRYPIPTGWHWVIEDVVVDSAARGKGVAEALSRHALAVAKAAGATAVNLTSRPSREAANRLYQRLGFVRRETNVYRYGFD